MPRARTRFVVDTPLGLRELMSVGEAASGDLNISVPRAAVSDHRDGGVLGTLPDKVSVHVSPGSPGYTITSQTLYENDDDIKRAVFIRDAKKGFIFPLFGRLPPWLDRAWKTRSFRSKDRLIETGKTWPRSETMLYVVWVMNADAPPILVEPDGQVRAYTADFQVFRLLLFPFFLPIPAVKSGSMVSPLSKARWNGEPIMAGGEGEYDPMPPSMIVHYNDLCISMLRQKHLDYVAGYFGPWTAIEAERRSRQVRFERYDQADESVG